MMEKVTGADIPGYIYCYESCDPKSPDQVHLKVGKTTKLARFDEWAKQCSSKKVVPLGWWPGKILHDEATELSSLKDCIQAGEKGKFCHRAERSCSPLAALGG